MSEAGEMASEEENVSTEADAENEGGSTLRQRKFVERAQETIEQGN